MIGLGNGFRVGILLLLLFGVLHSPGSMAEGSYTISTGSLEHNKKMIEIVKQAYHNIGMHPKFVFRPLQRSLVETSHGKFDAELGRVPEIGKKIPSLRMVPVPLKKVYFVALVRKDQQYVIENWEDVDKLPHGRVIGIQLLDNRLSETNANLVSDNETIIRLLKSNRIEVGVMIKSDARKLLKADDGIVMIMPPIEYVQLFHYVHESHKDLVEPLTEELFKLRQEARFRKDLED